MKCNQSRPGFDLVSPCPFRTTIIITPRALFTNVIIQDYWIEDKLWEAKMNWMFLHLFRFDESNYNLADLIQFHIVSKGNLPVSLVYFILFYFISNYLWVIKILKLYVIYVSTTCLNNLDKTQNRNTREISFENISVSFAASVWQKMCTVFLLIHWLIHWLILTAFSRWC